MNQSSFAHLHSHTEFSLLDGSNRIRDYLDRVKELEMESAAITDHGVMYGVVDFYKYAKEIGMKLVIGGSYDLRPFITAVAGDIDGRCAYCYRVRMEETAKYAAENGFDSFTTSLLISPYQNHDGIAAAAREMGERYGVEFLYRDFRPLFQEGQQFAREHGFYMQKYCGCVYSEEDRFSNRRKKELHKLHKAAGRGNTPC